MSSTTSLNLYLMTEELIERIDQASKAEVAQCVFLLESIVDDPSYGSNYRSVCKNILHAMRKELLKL